MDAAPPTGTPSRRRDASSRRSATLAAPSAEQDPGLFHETVGPGIRKLAATVADAIETDAPDGAALRAASRAADEA